MGLTRGGVGEAFTTFFSLPIIDRLPLSVHNSDNIGHAFFCKYIVKGPVRQQKELPCVLTIFEIGDGVGNEVIQLFKGRYDSPRMIVLCIVGKSFRVKIYGVPLMMLRSFTRYDRPLCNMISGDGLLRCVLLSVTEYWGSCRRLTKAVKAVSRL